MVKGYNKFNESRGNKAKKGARFQKDQRRNWLEETKPMLVKTTEPRGMPMEYSERFKYIITKIADKGNVIAKELLAAANKPSARFENSFLDLKGDDNISFIANGDRNVPDKYRSNKRQQAKIYKVIKTIFGSKFTSPEVKKFVSFYKQVYQQGPSKTDTSRPKLSNEELVKKLISDTKSNKIKWQLFSSQGNISRYDFTIKMTEKKKLIFNFFHFFSSKKDEMMSFISISILNELGKTENDKKNWIQTLEHKDLIEFIDVFKEKYKIVVN